MTDFNGPRDVPALWGLAKTAPYFWDGSIGTLNAAILRPVKGHMKRFVSGDCANSNTDECNTAAATLVAQLVAYVKTLDPPATAFDEGKLSASALRGEKLFQGKGGCIECHGGPLFTDNLTHNTAVPQVTFKSPYRRRRRACRDEQRQGRPAAAARGRLHRHPAARRLRRRAHRRLGVHQHPADARPQEHGAVHAQRRVPDPRAGRRASTTARRCRPSCAWTTPSRPLANTTRRPTSSAQPHDAEMNDLVAYLESL